MTAIQWVSRLLLLTVLGAASDAWADSGAGAEGLGGDRATETAGIGPAFQTAEFLDTATLHFGVTPLEAFSTAALMPGSKIEAEGSVTTSAADLAEMIPGDRTEVLSSSPQRAGTQVEQTISPAISQRAPQADPPSPWRVEFRPYLEVPFSVSGQLLFESVLDLGDIDITLAGTDVERLTITPNLSSASASTGLSPSELAALATTTLGGTTAPLPATSPGTLGTPASGTRTVQLNQVRGVDLSSVFLLGGELEIWYNDFAFLIDGFYANLGSRLLFGRSGSGGASQSILELGIDYTRIGMSLGWRAGRFPLVSREGVLPSEVFPAVTVDLFGGARYSSYGFDFVSTNTQLSYRANPSWVEPIFQTRAEVLFDSRTKLTLNGYVGGFGLGNSPNLSWGGSAGLDWRFLPNVSVRPSYKFASVDWDGGGDIVDLTTHSLWLGFTVYFN